MIYFVQILTAFIGSLGFSVLFHIRKSKLLLAGFGGIISWGVYLVMNNLVSDNEVLDYFIAAMAVTVYSEILARLKKTPTTTFLVSGIIPMIPGGALYYTMNYALQNEWNMFSKWATYTVQLAIAIAVGIIVISTLVKMITGIYRVFVKVREQNG